MSIDELCFNDLPFLRYLNEKILLYSITLLTFSGIFCLIWIMNKYTILDKCRIPQGSIPTFPYGNFKDVVCQKTTLYEFVWKYHNRFAKKDYRFGGLFLFTKPAIIITCPEFISTIENDEKAFKNIFPKRTKFDFQNMNLFEEKFLEKYNHSVKGSLSENLIKDQGNSVLRNFLLETVCLAFGFKSCEMVEEINILLKEKSCSSFRYYLSLSYPFIKKSRKELDRDLKEIFLEIMDERKKNNLRKDDIMQFFIEYYNEPKCCVEDVVNEIFDIFADTLTFSYSTTLLCLFELAINLEIQEDVIAEIRRFNKKYASINSTNLDELKYLNDVVRETLRKYPPIPTIIKECSEDYCNTELGVELPRNVLILVSTFAMHRDPQNFTKPDLFDPDRFPNDKGFFKSHCFMPFGTAEEMHIATLHTKLALISVFSSLRISLKESSSNVLRFDPKLLTLHPQENFCLKYTPL